MARSRSSSSSSSKWRYCNPSYYLKRPKRLALLLIVFVCASLFVWDRQNLVREHEVNKKKEKNSFNSSLSCVFYLFVWLLTKCDMNRRKIMGFNIFAGGNIDIK